ncbi:serine/threonine-protein kinase PknK [Pleurocapsales cyanobacterium LEGE 10410]|nr:serine/threonine-protein kinase PknK [Pleurocapsales cyanobacterium LEGE 10410]
MTSLSRYKIIERVYTDSSFHIYRAIRQQEKTLVVIKTANPQFDQARSAVLLKNEYEVLKNLNCGGILKPYSFEKYQNNVALILENFAGTNLLEFIKTQQLSTRDFFTIAIALVKTLQKIHNNRIVHKIIQPSSIFIHPKTLETKISNFSIATNFVNNSKTFSKQSEVLNLAYVSPEQTERINLPFDYRTDFYSLGVVFYQMLTGQLPFTAQDSLELIHCHLALSPTPPHQLNSSISKTVSSIVIKLLAKNPQDRYQNAYGIKADLEICQIQYQNQGKVEIFDIGILDKFSKLIIYQKLYGRSEPAKILKLSLKRVYSGTTELTLIKGDSGVGKSTFIQKIVRSVVKQKGYFVEGKFEQLQNNAPYQAVIQAFGSLIEQLLTETPERLQTWKEKILSAVGRNGKVITDVLPRLKLIIGCQPAIPELPATEAQNRFYFVFEKFFKVFAHREHPLVLLLDDLQWADPASLRLIDYLLDSFDGECLLIIGSYRSKEISSARLLVDIIEKIRRKITINEIVLQPLTINDINQLLVDTLHCEAQSSLSLAGLLFDRTKGNPFFLNQLLKTLYDDKLLTFNFDSSSWQWQIEEIRSANITNLNVLELIAKNLDKIPKSSQEVLKTAACIGNYFDLTVLAIACKQTEAEVALELEYALKAGIILANEEQGMSYKFVHDRVRLTAYSLLDETQRIRIHFKIGRVLLRQTPPSNIEDNIFVIVNHLNIARNSGSNISFLYRLAELNLIAGKKAKEAIAYEMAANFI